MTVKLAETQNETILTLYKSCIFSENIFAWFEADLQPVFSDKIEDLMLPQDRVIQQNYFSDGTKNKGVFELYSFNEATHSYLYAGRLYAPESYAKVHFSNL